MTYNEIRELFCVDYVSSKALIAVKDAYDRSLYEDAKEFAKNNNADVVEMIYAYNTAEARGLRAKDAAKEAKELRQSAKKEEAKAERLRLKLNDYNTWYATRTDEEKRQCEDRAILPKNG